MADQENVQVNQASTQNGDAPVDDVRPQLEAYAGDIAAAYERARQEMNEAVRALRAEIERIDLAQARARVQSAVEQNPTLAVFLGIGAGILLGRALSQALRPAPPPLRVRARRNAMDLAEQARGFAAGIGAVIAQQAASAAHEAQKQGAIVSKHARVLGDEVARRAHEAGVILADRTGDWSERISEAAHDVQKSVQKKAKQVRKKVGRKRTFAEATMDALGTAAAAVALERVSKWIKKMA